MSWYKWLQQEGGEESWKLILAEQEDRIVRDKKPAFVTILAADNDFVDKMSAEDHAKVHYKGPLYFDFDASSLEEATEQFQKFLNKLKDEHSFDLRQAALFASGGKGYHCIIPQQCFIPKPSPKGYTSLPAIYKEIAQELYVDCLDLRVYTARRGRQFRVANVERPDKPGIHKVPLTVDEALSMDEALYRELIKAPRFIAPSEAPELNAGLALLFSQALDKVDKAQKNRKQSKADENLLRKFNGDVPPTVVSLMSGVGVVEGIGFQKIATQLAIAAHALGRSEEQFLSLCSGLCDNHVSDGSRYNTPEKRRRELSRMYQYMHENPCYTFSVGGIKSLAAKDFATPDLDDGGVEATEEESETKEDIEYSLTAGLRVNKNGIWRKTEEGLTKICALGVANPRLLKDAQTASITGYEVDVFVDGHPRGAQILDLGTFLSRNKFCQFTLSTGGASVNANDAQIGAIADILRVRAMKAGQEVFTVGREGFDMITLPDGSQDMIWADVDGVVSRRGGNYRLMGTFMDGTDFKTDIRRCPHLRAPEKAQEGVDIIAGPDAIEFFERLFSMNTIDALGRMWGWYNAAFISQPIRQHFDQFPLLQVFGPAGSGKTQTNLLLAKMHFWRRKPVLATATHATPFVMENLVTCSASLPLIFDEVKPREMTKDRIDKLKMLMRTNYNAGDIKKGRLSNETGASKLDIRRGINGVPMVFIGEALESQTAIEDRCMIVSINKEGKRGHSQDFKHCAMHAEYLSAYGRNMIDRLMQVNPPALQKEVLRQQAIVEESWGTYAEDHDRPLFNVAVGLTGIELSRRVMTDVFGSHFDATFERMKEAIVQIPMISTLSGMTEMAKVLDCLAHLTTLNPEWDPRFALRFGEDYSVNPHTNCVELRVRNVFSKYLQFSKALGQEALFDSFEPFNAALATYPGTKDRYCVDSPIKMGTSVKVYALDIDRMSKDGVSDFHIP